MYEVILKPYYECLNPNNTPCIFHFDAYCEAEHFVAMVFRHGDSIEVTINNCETE